MMHRVLLPTTLLIADLTGTVRLFGELEEEDALAVQACYLDVMSRIVERNGGVIDEARGDEIMARFDAGRAACIAASEIQRKIATLPVLAGLNLGVRVGLYRYERARRGAPGDELREQAALLTLQTAPGQILMTRAVREEVGSLPAEAGSLVSVIAPDGAWELQWQQERVVTPSQLDVGPSLVFRYAGEVFYVDANRPLLTLGRERSNSIKISARKASREHASIQWQAGKIVYRDLSTNGSFITLEADEERVLRKADLELVRPGKVSFGGSLNDDDADVAEFEVIR